MTWVDKNNLQQTFKCIDTLVGITILETDINAEVITKNIRLSKTINKFTGTFIIPPDEYKILKEYANKEMPSFKAKSTNEDYNIVNSCLSSLKDNIFEAINSNDFSVGIDLYEITNIKDDEKYYYRYIVPFDNKLNNRDYECKGYNSNGKQQAGILIEIDSLKTHLYTNNTYLIIEPQYKCSYEELEKIAYIGLLTLGLFSSTIYLQESYAVASETGQFDKIYGVRYKSLRDTIKCQYGIFTTNAYSVLVPFSKRLTCSNAESRMMDILNNKWRCRINYISKDVFSNMAKLLFDNEALARAALTIIDASKFGLEIQAAAYCVAFETICSFIISKNKNKIPKPVEDSNWNSLQEDLNQVVNNSNIEDEGKDILINKIKNLNQPTNKDKLMLPFNVVEYELSKEETDVINDRNRFLHGGLNINKGEKDSDKLFFSSIVYHKLCCILLFKLSEFSGHIINNTAIYDFGTIEVTDKKWGFKVI